MSSRKNFLIIVTILFVLGSTEVHALGNWTQQDSGTTTHSLTDVHFVDKDFGWVVGTTGLILNTTNGGKNWTKQTPGTASYHLWGVSFADKKNGWAVGDSGLILNTTNGGVNWTLQNSGTTSHLEGVYFVNSTVGWVVGADNKILKTTNGGVNWTLQNSGVAGSFFTGVHFIDANIGWVVGSPGRILKTTNGGANWTLQNSGIGFTIWGLYFVSNTTGWAVASNGVIKNTTNGGANWTSQGSGTPTTLFDVHFVDKDFGWIAGDALWPNGTVLYTGNGGTNWTLQSVPFERYFGVYFTSYSDGWVVGEHGRILKYSGDCIDLTGLNEYYVNSNTKLCYRTYQMNDTNHNGAIIMNASSVELNCNNATMIGDGSPGSIGINSVGRNNNYIHNCTVGNYSVGIGLSSSNNNLIVNNTLFYNYFQGLDISSSVNNSIYNNTIYLNLRGIYTYLSQNHTIIGNNIFSNEQDGIFLDRGSYGGQITSSIIRNNSIYRNGRPSSIDSGIHFYKDSNNLVSHNFIYDNLNYGIEVESSVFNSIINNTIYENNLNFGLYFSFSNNSIVSRNNVSLNAVGIGLDNSNDNLIYDNNFTNSIAYWSINNAADTGINNWNITKTHGTNIIGGPYIGGNFWDNYLGIDTDGDGLGDTDLPYNSSGFILYGGDYLPLVQQSCPDIVCGFSIIGGGSIEDGGEEP